MLLQAGDLIKIQVLLKTTRDRLKKKTFISLPFLVFFFSVFRCNLRILDSFGTDAEFNYAEYLSQKQGLEYGWGAEDVHLRQMMTMFRKTILLYEVVEKTIQLETTSRNSKTTDRLLSIAISRQLALCNRELAVCMRSAVTYTQIGA